MTNVIAATDGLSKEVMSPEEIDAIDLERERILVGLAAHGWHRYMSSNPFRCDICDFTLGAHFDWVFDLVEGKSG